MTPEEQEKLREIVKRIGWFIKDRKRALDIHTAPYKKYEKGGSKEGKDITSDPNWIKDKGWIEGTADALMAWESSKGWIMDAFPEIFAEQMKEETQ